MKIDAKPFKTLEEQVEILNKWGNGFLSEDSSEKVRVLEYLKKYNFQTSVDSFAPLLWQNLDDGISEIDLKFINNFKFDDLFDLFNFNNGLKNIISELLQDFEKRLRTAIIYHTLKAVNFVCKDTINLPFILLDDSWTQTLGKLLFTNNLSKQSFLDKDKKFKFTEYYSFLAKYLEPFDIGSLFLKNADIKTFFFGKVAKNWQKIQNAFNYESNKLIQKIDNNSPFLSFEIEDLNNHKIFCTFNEFFKWCSTKIDIHKSNANESPYKNKILRGMINVLAKSFLPLYKSFTQEAFGDMIKFFSKLNENIQLDIIKERFPSFYLKVSNLIKDKQNFNLILIGSFISFLNVFRNLRNKIAHLDIIYNFWDIHTPINSSAGKTVMIKQNEFWITNKPTCDFLNEIFTSENNNFESDYFKARFLNKKVVDYLTKINSLHIRIYCKYKNNTIYFANQSKEKDIWPLPMFFLKDTVNWLLFFLNDKSNFNQIVNDVLLKANIDNSEIRNRLHDYLFNKIIISLEKIDDKN